MTMCLPLLKLFASPPPVLPPRALLARMPYFGSCRTRRGRLRFRRGRQREERRPRMGPCTKVPFLGSFHACFCFFLLHLILMSYLYLEGAALLLGSFDSPSVMRILRHRGQAVPADQPASTGEQGDKEMASLAR